MNKLTETQEKLIEQIKKEFLVMNESKSPTSFADLMLNEIDETRKEFELISKKNQSLFLEYSKEHKQNVEYLRVECAKLGIEIEEQSLGYDDTSQFTTSNIILMHPKYREYNVYISVRIPTRYHMKNGLKIYELHSKIQYGITHWDLDHMYDFNVLMSKSQFKERVISLYHRIQIK
jgi:hypothetical protein